MRTMLLLATLAPLPAFADDKPDAVAEIARKMRDRQTYSYSLKLAGLTQQVEVEDASDHVVTPLVVERAFAPDGKGGLALTIRFKGDPGWVTVKSRGHADDVYAVRTLALGPKFTARVLKDLGASDDVQELRDPGAPGKLMEQIPPELLPAILLAGQRYDEKRAELVSRFNKSFLHYPDSTRMRWAVHGEGKALFLEGSCHDLMYHARFRVELRRAKDGAWEYVRVLAKEEFKGE